METRVFSAYNLARGVLLNSKLAVADTGNQPLKLLDIVISGMGMDSTAGLWLTPLHAIPAVPRVFPFDIVYLDKDYRVLESAQMGPGIDFPAFRPEVASALVLPSEVLSRTQTEAGDRLIVCAAKELEALLAASGDVRSAAEPAHTPGSSDTPDLQTSPEPPVPADPGKLSPGPSIAVTQAVRERSLASIVEHHLGPEDLFSNWVASSPTPPPPAETPGSRLPQQDRTAASKNGKQKTGKTAAPVTPVAEPESPAAEQQTESSSQSAVPPRQQPATTSPVPPPEQSALARPATTASVPQPRPITTFTAGAYGMWPASQPTAIAPVAPKSPPQSPQSSSNRITGAKPADPPPARPATPRSEVAGTPPASRTAPEMRAATKPAPTTAPSARQPASGPAASPAPPKPLAMPSPPPSSAPPRTAPASQPSAPTQATPAIPSAKAAVATQPKPANSAPKPRPAPAAVEAKPAPPLGNLRAKFKQWLNPVATPSDRRRAARRYVPGMVAHYFTGGAPRGHEIADISMTGMYLLTGDRWMPGTMIQMTIQKPCAQGERKQSMNVLSRIVRRGSDGVAIEFVMPDALSHIGHDIQPSQATDKFALARFL